jgi:hypothetical protein
MGPAQLADSEERELRDKVCRALTQHL